MVHFLEWFGKKREKDVFEHSLVHMKKVVETVRYLHEAIKSLDDKLRLKELLHMIAKTEHEADQIRKQFALDIVKGEILLVGYTDLLNFIKKVDAIADWAHTTDRYIALWEGTLNNEIKKRLLDLTSLALKATEKLYETTQKVSKSSKEEILTYCAEIENLEEVADDEKRELLRVILKSDFKAGELLVLREIVESIENICDFCEISADIIRMLITEMK